MLATKTKIAGLTEEYQRELEEIKKLRSSGSKAGSDYMDFLWGLLAGRSEIRYSESRGGIVLNINLQGHSHKISQEERRHKPSLVKRAIAEAIANAIHMHKIHLEDINKEQMRVTIP